MQEILEDSPAAPRSADDYLALARTQAPGHPLLDLIDGWRLAKDRQWEQALPLLERGVTDQPRHANSELLPMLWAARFAVLPAAQALQRPFAQGHGRSEEHTSELQSPCNLVCRLLLEKQKKQSR